MRLTFILALLLTMSANAFGYDGMELGTNADEEAQAQAPEAAPPAKPAAVKPAPIAIQTAQPQAPQVEAPKPSPLPDCSSGKYTSKATAEVRAAVEKTLGLNFPVKLVEDKKQVARSNFDLGGAFESGPKEMRLSHVGDVLQVQYEGYSLVGLVCKDGSTIRVNLYRNGSPTGYFVAATRTGGKIKLTQVNKNGKKDGDESFYKATAAR